MRFPDLLAAQCVQMWLDSPAHRQNLLDGKWSLIGIGAVQLGGTLYCTQLFAAPQVTVEQAELSAAGDDVVQLQIDGEYSGTVTLEVNGQRMQTLSPTGGNFTVAVSYPRNSGRYDVCINADGQQAWNGQFDTGCPDQQALQVTRVSRAGVVQRTAVSTIPFTGLRVTGIVRSLSGQPISVLRDGEVVAILIPDDARRVTFDLLLPQHDALYVIGFMVAHTRDNLLYIDTQQSPALAFRCRPSYGANGALHANMK